MRAAGIAGGLHAELARRVGRQEPAFKHAASDHRARVRGHALIIEGAAAECARLMRIFIDIEMRRKHLGAKRIDQETRLAIERAATCRAHETA